MKKLIILLLILFFYVFIKSGTLEQKQWREERDGIEYLRNSYSLRWGNFSGYLQKAYQTAVNKIKPR